MFDVITVGSATIDHFLTTEKKLMSVKLGDKVLASDVEIHTGGGGTNSAAALALMGLKTKCLVKVGDDDSGDLIKKELSKKYQVRIVQTKRSKKSTDFSAIIHSVKEKDRIIYVYKGASDDLRWSDFNKKDLKAKWMYLATLMHDAWPTAVKLANHCKKHNIKLLFNPSKYLASKGKNYLKPVLKHTSVLVLNKSEAKSMLRSKSSNVDTLAKQLLSLGPNIVVITSGPGGAYITDGKQIVVKKAIKVKVINTAGAGDAFTSGFLAGIIKNASLEKAVQIGVANASSVITKIGTKNGLLTWNNAVRFHG